MFNIKSSLMIIWLSMLVNNGGAAACRAQRNSSSPQNTNTAQRRDSPRNATPTPASSGGNQTVNDSFNVLAQGSHSSIEEPFVAVVRDAETYAALRESESSLPEKDAAFFESNAVIAAFLGTRNTGGYSVSIARGRDSRFRINENAPPRDAMQAQVITTPFKIIAAPVAADGSIQLELGEAWREAARRYRVTSGSFTMSGGIAGRAEEFRLDGELHVSHQGRLATLIFDLRATGTNRPRTLQTAATGIRQPGNVAIARLDAGTLVDPPHNGLRATGRFANEVNNLTVTLSSLPSNIADGFSGQGSFEAGLVRANSPR